METGPDNSRPQPGPSPTTRSLGASEMAQEPMLVDPSDSEIEAWAERERQRRAAWLDGPTREQKLAWAEHERERRLAEFPETQSTRSLLERARLSQRYMREAQLASEGMMNLFWKLSLRGLDVLLREGREWEEEFAPQARGGPVSADEEKDPE